MNKKLISILLVISIPLTAIASPKDPSNPGLPSNKEQKMTGIFNELGLNQDEKAKVLAIIKDEKMKLNDLKAEKQSRLQAVLTPEQLAKFNALEQQRHHKQPDNGGGNNTK